MPRYDLDGLGQRDGELLSALARHGYPLLEAWFRPVVRGLDRLPTGPALLVGNHSGGMVTADSFVLGVALHRAYGLAGLPYALAHEVVLGTPGLHQLLVRLGAVRACHDNATRIFERGHKVLVYPGGDIDSMRSFADRDRVVFGPRRGYVRLALRQGVPIVPVVAAGSHATSIVLSDGRALAKLLGLRRYRMEVCPVTLSVPWGLVVGITPPYLPLPTRIYLEMMEPIRFDRAGERAARDDAYVEACHQQVHGAMQARLSALAGERRRRRFGPRPPSDWSAGLARAPAPPASARSPVPPSAPVDVLVPPL